MGEQNKHDIKTLLTAINNNLTLLGPNILQATHPNSIPNPVFISNHIQRMQEITHQFNQTKRVFLTLKPIPSTN